MKWTIIYFSGTGNTELISRELTAALNGRGEEVVSLPLEEALKDPAVLDNADGLGIGFPVYKFTYPENLEQLFPFLRERSLPGGRIGAAVLPPRPLFLFSTYCRFNANSLNNMARAVVPAGFFLTAARGFKCPSNGIGSLQTSDSFEYRSVMYFENRIDKGIDDFAGEIVLRPGYAGTDTTTGECVAAGAAYPREPLRLRPRRPLNRMKINIVGRVEKARYPFLSIDRELCTGCGLCVKKCPEGNLVLTGGTAEPKDPEECLHCLRCLHLCSTHAVSFGPLVHGPGRYTRAIRDSLFREARERAIDAPEPGTPSVRRRWAAGNLRYWLSGRGRRAGKQLSARRQTSTER